MSAPIGGYLGLIILIVGIAYAAGVCIERDRWYARLRNGELKRVRT